MRIGRCAPRACRQHFITGTTSRAEAPVRRDRSRARVVRAPSYRWLASFVFFDPTRSTPQRRCVGNGRRRGLSALLRRGPTVARLEERLRPARQARSLFRAVGRWPPVALSPIESSSTNVVVGWLFRMSSSRRGRFGAQRACPFGPLTTQRHTSPRRIQWRSKRHSTITSRSRDDFENTHMASGGTPVSRELLRGIAALRLGTMVERGCQSIVASGIARGVRGYGDDGDKFFSNGLSAPGAPFWQCRRRSPTVRASNVSDSVVRSTRASSPRGPRGTRHDGRTPRRDHTGSSTRAVVEERGPIASPIRLWWYYIGCFEHRDPGQLLHHLQQNGVLAGTVARGRFAFSPTAMSTTRGSNEQSRRCVRND